MLAVLWCSFKGADCREEMVVSEKHYDHKASGCLINKTTVE